MELFFLGPLTINPPPEVIIKVGDTAVLNCNSTSVPTPTVTWKQNKTEIENSSRFSVSDDGVLFILATRQEDMGLYSCDVSNGYYEKEGNISLNFYGIIIITVHSQICKFTFLVPVPPSITGVSSSYIIIRNNSVTLSVNVQKGLPPIQPSDIQWFFDDGLNEDVELKGISNHIFSSDRNILTIVNAQVQNRGTYKVKATNTSNVYMITLDVYGELLSHLCVYV